MLNVHIPDCVLHHILSRLPTKHILQCRLVSTNWNNLITDPYFMKSISHPMILLNIKPLCITDSNAPVDDSTRSITDMRFPFPPERVLRATIVGTFNGVVVLVVRYHCAKDMCVYTRMMLYNPLTGVSKIIPDPPSSPSYHSTHAYGFSYGAPNELKIVTFRRCYEGSYVCDVFSIKDGSWSTSWSSCMVSQPIRKFQVNVGVFLNGSLHWITYAHDHYDHDDMVILALDVKKMVVSEIDLPINRRFIWTPNLGTLDGCLCTMNKSDDTRFDMWVMKELGLGGGWSKAYSFAMSLEGKYISEFFLVSVLEKGRLLMTDGSREFIMYDTLEGSYQRLGVFASPDDYWELGGMEYVETLISPLDLSCV